ncbi:PREDICTED: uncharacterized protein C7orf50 homolog isoform X4 [Hipposideros armiger]|uniref:Uncharacterized protein C7orf50 homolog isoform X4 n=1 Tax=Hipposideros armiger TaxID=186990 RepID=A0A8B7QWJ9_HIPAR|nr:PREDICTED: uncharacterized protein C7orf50 homolog isoform X4 [Hipposideros armiger]
MGMAKQKRKVTEVTGKKNKKLKKASAEEILLAPDATQGTKEARPEACAWTLGPRRVGARFPEGPSESRSPCVWSPAPPSWVACGGGRAGEGCVVSVLVWWCWTVGLHVLHGNSTCSWLGRRTPAMPCRVASPDVPSVQNHIHVHSIQKVGAAHVPSMDGGTHKGVHSHSGV